MTDQEIKDRIEEIMSEIRHVVGNCFQDMVDYPDQNEYFELFIQIPFPDGKIRYESTND